MIPVLELIRLEEAESGTLGILKIQKQIAMFTLEPQDLLNKTSVSSIPAQQYICKRYLSPTYGETFKVTNVPDRSDILFHWGNWANDTEGCILVGTSIMTENRGVSNSKKAFQRFMEILKDYDEAHLTIKEVY